MYCKWNIDVQYIWTIEHWCENIVFWHIDMLLPSPFLILKQLHTFAIYKVCEIKKNFCLQRWLCMCRKSIHISLFYYNSIKKTYFWLNYLKSVFTSNFFVCFMKLSKGEQDLHVSLKVRLAVKEICKIELLHCNTIQ